eukprot:gene7114-7918_t
MNNISGNKILVEDRSVDVRLIVSFVSLYFAVPSALLQTCCISGTEAGKAGGCAGKPVIPQVNALDAFICKALWRSCCLQEKQKRSCRSGMDTAMRTQTCSNIPGDTRSLLSKQLCCNFCLVGFESAAAGQTCQSIQSHMVSRSCCSAFKKNKSLKDKFSKGRITKNETCATKKCSYSCKETSSGPACYCLPGFRLSRDGLNCYDIDECKENASICSLFNTCFNTRGSYYCSRQRKCGEGYEPSGNTCVDIDECVRTPYVCGRGQCLNQQGSYYCRCDSGYVFNATSKTCEDYNPCNDVSCEYKCQNLGRGVYRCLCPKGEVLNSDRRSCRKYDPCESHRCEYQCEAIDGNRYRCTCPEGHQLMNDGIRCKINSYKVSLKINNVDPILRYKLVWHEKGQKKDLIIPRSRTIEHDLVFESAVTPQPLEFKLYDMDNLLIKINGKQSFSVIPHIGEIDVRLHVGQNDNNPCRAKPCSQKCEDVGGGRYRCSCWDGYEMKHGGKCVVIQNPCTSNPCQHKCYNLGRGRFFCTCPTGQTLNDDKRTCKVTDPCRYNQCQWKCTPDGDKAKCICPKGYTVSGDRCRDIDECRTGTRCDAKNYQCFNTYGGYKCVPKLCPKPYYKLYSDRYCYKGTCKKDDVACKNDKVYSYQWLNSKVVNNLPPDYATYYYSLYKPSFNHHITFRIKSGNEDDAFYLQRDGDYRVTIKNRKKLVGPKDYKLTLLSSVYKDGMAQESENNKVVSKRIFVGGLFPEVSKEDIKGLFKNFGSISAVDVIQRKDNENGEEISKTFAYVNINGSEKNINKCISVYGKTKWKGHELKLQVAKESYLTRLKREQEMKTTATNGKEKRQTKTYDALVEKIAKTKAAVPGTEIADERNWVVGKYGRALPVVYLREQGFGKTRKFDPSKHCHQLRKLKDDYVDEISGLTWSIEEETRENGAKLAKENSNQKNKAKRKHSCTEEDIHVSRKEKRKEPSSLSSSDSDNSFDEGDKESENETKKINLSDSDDARYQQKVDNDWESFMKEGSDVEKENTSSAALGDSIVEQIAKLKTKRASFESTSEKSTPETSQLSLKDDTSPDIGVKKKCDDKVSECGGFAIIDKTIIAWNPERDVEEVIDVNDLEDCNDEVSNLYSSIDQLSASKESKTVSEVMRNEKDNKQSNSKGDLERKKDLKDKSSKKKAKENSAKKEFSEEKRQKYLTEREKIEKERRSLVKNALQNIDLKNEDDSTQKHVKFDSSDDNLTTEDDVVRHDNKTQEFQKVTGNAAVSWLGLDSSEGSDDDNDDDVKMSYEKNFNLKPQFEGEQGERLFKLQKKMGLDARFKIDERFLENEDNADNDVKKDEERDNFEGNVDANDEDNNYDLKTEKMNALSILEKILGKKPSSLAKEAQQTDPMPHNLVRYDPLREDHVVYEVKDELPDSKTDEGMITKSRIKDRSAFEEAKNASTGEANEQPVVSSDKFFEVTDSIKDLFHNKESSTFSFLKNDEDVHDQEPDKPVKDPIKISSKLSKFRNMLEDDVEQENMTQDNDNYQNYEDGGTASIDHFFFTKDDPRLKSDAIDGPAAFMRVGSFDEITKCWEAKKQNLRNDFKRKHKDAIRRRKKLTERRTFVK